MKGKKFYLILIGLIVVGISSLFIYKQQQEARALDFEGYEIATIESNVNDLYNEEKTDIKENISEQLIELEQILNELEEKELSYRNETRIDKMRNEFLIAKEMHDLEIKTLELFEEETIVSQTVTDDVIKDLENALAIFEDKTVFYKRNQKYISKARVQLEHIEEVSGLLENLTKDEEVTKETLDKIEELINQIKNESIQKDFLKRIEKARVVVNEAEESSSTALDGLEEENLEELSEEENSEEEVLVEEEQESKSETAQSTEQQSSPVEKNNAQTNLQSSTHNNRGNNTQTNKSTSTPPSSQNRKPTRNQTESQNSNKPSVPENNLNEETNNTKEKYQETVIEEIPFSTIVNKNSSLEIGTEIVYPAGSPGSREIIYEVTINPNGTSSKKLISNTVIKPPIDRVVTEGTKKTAPVEEPPVDEGIDE